MNVAIPSDPESVPVYLILGSNIDPETNLPLAIKNLDHVLGIIAQSSIWQTPAVGFEGEDFLNAAVLIYTCISAKTLKNEILRPLEALSGRVRTKDKFNSRTIDIDILIYHDELIDKELWTQAHLAVPIAEIYPGYQREGTGETLKDVADTIKQTQPIEIWEGSVNRTEKDDEKYE